MMNKIIDRWLAKPLALRLGAYAVLGVAIGLALRAWT